MFQRMEKCLKVIHRPAQKIAAILAAALLFAGAFPNPLFLGGFPIVAWIAFVPVFWVARNSSLAGSALWGIAYAMSAYGFYNYWLSVFHPLAGTIVGVIYAAYFAILFPLLTISYRLFPKRGYVVQWLLWLSYEYLRTLGFLGYPYGIIGYSQWRMTFLIQIAEIVGVWGISALVVFPSAFIAAALQGGYRNTWKFLKSEKYTILVWGAATACSLAYGLISPVDYSASPKKRIALVQNNSDPWRGGIAAYRENFLTLKRLSDVALAAEKKPDLVVWSETAFVPRIFWHSTYRDDPESYILVKELLDYLARQRTPFVIGNDDGRKEATPAGNWERVDYNAVLLYVQGQERGVYRKMHLVPFTEHFPYERQFPAIYRALKAADTHFWKKGTDPTVFTIDGFKFSTPICFEDTFGYISRRFVSNGADLLVNVTNDAWAKSLSAQNQHLGMAVFRAVENRRTMVRATASGQTCAIDPNGRIIEMADPFIETQLTVEVPIYNHRKTIYTRYGDYLGAAFIVLSGMTMACGLGRKIRGNLRKRVGLDISANSL